MIVSFIRHFESEANAANVLAGQLDYRLSDRGRKDAALTAEKFLAESPITRIISSPLVRALETAAPFAQATQIEPEIEPAITEQNMGIFSGKTYPWAEAHPNYEQNKSARWDWVPPGGESYRMIAERLSSFFGRLDSLNGRMNVEDRVLVVTHAVTLRLIQAILEDTVPRYPTKLARNGEILETLYRGNGTPHEIAFRYFGSDADGRE